MLIIIVYTMMTVLLFVTNLMLAYQSVESVSLKASAVFLTACLLATVGLPISVMDLAATQGLAPSALSGTLVVVAVLEALMAVSLCAVALEFANECTKRTSASKPRPMAVRRNAG